MTEPADGPQKPLASRRNGALSRGPTTAVGKRHASGNALKHGLRAKSFKLTRDEDPKVFELFDQTLRAELQPEGALQSLVASRAVLAAWRLLRADRIEGDLLDGQSVAFGRPQDGPVDLGLALIRDGHGARAFDTLLRYRSSSLKEFWQALDLLRSLQRQNERDMEVLTQAVSTKRT